MRRPASGAPAGVIQRRPDARRRRCNGAVRRK